MLKLVKYPDKRLRKKCEEITTFDAKLRDTVVDMCHVMCRNQGAGLAAPQVGLPVRMFVMDEDLGPHVAICNPSWEPEEDAKLYGATEGCLSIPGLFLTIDRWDKIKVKYQDVCGESHSYVLNGFAAHVFQHETEHLDGILMIDHLEN